MKLILQICFFLVLASPLGTQAQTLRAFLTGTVADENHQPVPSARIRLIHEETGTVRSVTPDAQGVFTVAQLSPGPYQLEAESAGYQSVVQNFTLRVNQELRLDIVLIRAGRTETINVTATRELLRTDSAALGAVIETRQIRNLPLDGRNFYELSLLVPGVLPPAQGSAGSVRGDFAVNVNGAREDSNLFLLDGVYNADPKLNGIAVNPPVDGVREFEVATNSYDASFGRNPGGQINVVLRSGSNQFHGTAYEFFRNAALDARNFFAPAGEPKPAFSRNQFGGNLGGPLLRNRTFFFADYEGRRSREGLTRLTRVPTAAERAGDFSSSFASPVNPFTSAPFPGNRLPREFLHPIGVALANLYPLPNRADPVQNFVSSPLQRDRSDQFDVRLDQALARAEITFRYSFVDRTLYEPFAGPTFSQVPNYGNFVPRRAQNLMLSENRTLTPALINELRFGFNRVSQGAFPEITGRNVNSAVGLPDPPNPRDVGLSFVTVTGFSPLGHEFNNPQQGSIDSYQFLNHLTWARGRRLLKLGGDVRLFAQDAYRDVQSRGFLQFRGVYTRNPLADLLLGLPTITGIARLDNPQRLRGQSFNLFVNDTHRLRAGLTLMLGLRWEFNRPPVDAGDRANLYDPATRSLVRVGTAGIPRAGYFPDRNNFGPRFGLAWSLRQGTVLRTGYGIYFDQSALAPSEGLYFSPPYFDLRLFVVSATQQIRLENPFPANFPRTPGSAFSFQRDLRTPYVQHWNVSLQQRLGRSRVLETAYVASKGTKLYSARDINQAVPNAALPFPLRPVVAFDDITQLESRGNSNYHSLQTRLQQSYQQGLSLIASYTLGKSIDDASGFFPSAGDPNFPQDSENVRLERARSNFDVRQRFTAGYSYDLPLGKGKFLGGWQANGILTFQTGRPFTVSLQPEDDNSNSGRSNLGFGANDRPNVNRNPRLAVRSPERWFDTTAFSKAPRGSFGNAGRNILDGPGLATVNLSLVKETPLGETATLQLRLETFNLFNRVNLDLPDIYFESPSFGRIQSAGNPRRIQLGAKFVF
ncbi:MAG: Plug and carboxypeptidase regulatory-like domain-containing protein [Bryobacteraceae bacterium]|nr:Plug and carboxypeptidase regulatory-like domain-containing protein [Bryobacteraceae bacterium]MDW8379889.1 carboxypeptidase regulatory-like domain-containing protein [Bryobacterales bacterium]